MVFIIEGIDKVGKTTLIKEFSKKTNIKSCMLYNPAVIKAKDFDNNNETDKYLREISILQTYDLNIIFDRFHLSDFVYGLIERNYNLKLAIENFKKIEDKLLKLKIMLILVEPLDCKKSSIEHGSDLSVHNDIFNIIFEKSKIANKIKTNFNEFENCQNKMIQFMNDCLV